MTENVTIEVVNEQNTSALDVAYWFLLKDKMDQKKIQKLSYYAQAWSLVLLGRDIASDVDFEAWVHGPVNMSIRDNFRKYRWRDFKLDGEEGITFAKSKAALFNDDEQKVLESVWETYGHLTGNQLEVLTHSETPWLNARKDYGPDQRCDVEISREDMFEYYSGIYNGDL